MIKTIDDAIDQFVEDLDFDVLIIWADTLEVEHDEEMWLDDMWPDHENELRVKVSEALLDAISPMKKFYFTFGFGQPHENGYHVIEAKNSNKARAEMFHKFGDKWSMQYDSAEAAGVKKYNLKEIK